jgi:hypothetical protein
MAGQARATTIDGPSDPILGSRIADFHLCNGFAIPLDSAYLE